MSPNDNAAASKYIPALKNSPLKKGKSAIIRLANPVILPPYKITSWIVKIVIFLSSLILFLLFVFRIVNTVQNNAQALKWFLTARSLSNHIGSLYLHPFLAWSSLLCILNQIPLLILCPEASLHLLEYFS